LLSNLGLSFPVNRWLFPRKAVITYQDGIKAGIYMFSVIEFLVNMLLHTNAPSSGRFFPVDLFLVSWNYVSPKKAHCFVDECPKISKHVQV